MTWYTDEQYVMIQDSKEKKSIAASAFKQRTHCGKGGSVKFPSDYMSRKELKAMNGECKSYRMNEPISWSEFIEWPNEHKIAYIKRIRDKFGASDKYIAEMFDVSANLFLMYVKELGLEAKVECDDNWERQKFYAWRTGAKTGLVNEHTEFTRDTGESCETVEVPEEHKTYERSLMNWTEFKLMPDDKKVDYIKWVRETFNANDSAIAKAMGVGRAAYAKLIARLGIGVGKGSGHGKWNEEAFNKWCELNENVKTEGELVINEPTEIVIPSVGSLVTVEQNTPEVIEKPYEDEREYNEKNMCEIASDCEKKRIHEAGPIAFAGNSMPVIPKSGSMMFENNSADDALQVLKVLLGNARVKHLYVSWECAFEEG